MSASIKFEQRSRLIHIKITQAGGPKRCVRSEVYPRYPHRVRDCPRSPWALASSTAWPGRRQCHGVHHVRIWHRREMAGVAQADRAWRDAVSGIPPSRQAPDSSARSKPWHHRRHSLRSPWATSAARATEICSFYCVSVWCNHSATLNADWLPGKKVFGLAIVLRSRPKWLNFGV